MLVLIGIHGKSSNQGPSCRVPFEENRQEEMESKEQQIGKWHRRNRRQETLPIHSERLTVTVAVAWCAVPHVMEISTAY
jgi:hypothetical protein